MAVRQAQALITVLAINVYVNAAMKQPYFTIDIRRSDQTGSTVINLEPVDPHHFRVRAIFIVTDDGIPTWGIVPHGVYRNAGESNGSAELKGGRHVIFRKSPAGIPDALRPILSQVATEGKYLKQVTYGRVPEGFEQIVPEQAEPAPLDPNKAYRVFVIGTEGGAAVIAVRNSR